MKLCENPISKSQQTMEIKERMSLYYCCQSTQQGAALYTA